MNYVDEVVDSLNTMKVVIDPGCFLPERAHTTDAGLDLRTPIEVCVPARGSAIIDTGVHMALPAGTFGKIESKSGLNVKYGIVSCGGVVDEGYTGAIMVKLYNLTDKDYWFETGDKVAQLIVQPYKAPIMVQVDKLDETERNTGGFGSTGK